MDEKPTVAIVIVSWNVALQLKNCLQSINEYADQTCEVFVIDNDSEDESVQMAKSFEFDNSQVLRYEVIVNDDNYGFARACNQGIVRAQAQYVLLLNPDAQLKKETLSGLISCALEYPDAGVVGCRIENMQGRDQASVGVFPSLFNQLSKRLQLKWLKSRLKKVPFEYARPHFFDEGRVGQVDQVKGALFCITPEALKRIGSLDDKFFVWFEETDYCKRVWSAGLKVYFTPHVRVQHIGGASFKKVPLLKKQLIWNRSIRYYFRKHHGPFQGWLVAVLDPIFFCIGLVVQEGRRLTKGK